MKLVFSEAKPDYTNYTFPYVIWAFPEENEKPADLFNAGFLPSSRNLDRFYMCRQVRVDLAKYEASSENRRILRKGENIIMKLIPRVEFEYTPERRLFYKNYADEKFGKDVMGWERLDSLFSTKITSHVMLFTDAQTGAELGTITLYLEDSDLAFYSYAFYDLNHSNRSLGMFMMTSAVEMFAGKKFHHLYLGTCYTRNALYKTQFTGVQFFAGFRWSDNMEELKHLIDRDNCETSGHLLESEEYRQLFYQGQLTSITEATSFKVAADKLAH